MVLLFLVTIAFALVVSLLVILPVHEFLRGDVPSYSESPSPHAQFAHVPHCTSTFADITRADGDVGIDEAVRGIRSGRV
jgi:hypothetical protein